MSSPSSQAYSAFFTHLGREKVADALSRALADGRITPSDLEARGIETTSLPDNKGYMRMSRRVERDGNSDFMQPMMKSQHKPHVSAESREAFAAPAEIPQEQVDLRRKINKKKYKVMAKHPGMFVDGAEDASVKHRLTMPKTEFPQLGKNPTVKMSPHLAEPLMSVIDPEKSVPRAAKDTLNTAIMAHELGEASEFNKMRSGETKAQSHASHLGTQPILQENLHSLGDPDAQRFLKKMRSSNSDDDLMAETIKRVGGTPNSPIQPGTKRHRALKREFDRQARRVGQVTTGGKDLGSVVAGGFGGEVSYFPDAVNKELSTVGGGKETQKYLADARTHRGAMGSSQAAAEAKGVTDTAKKLRFIHNNRKALSAGLIGAGALGAGAYAYGKYKDQGR